MLEEPAANNAPQAELVIRYYPDNVLNYVVEVNEELGFLAYCFLLDTAVCLSTTEEADELWRQSLNRASYYWMTGVNKQEYKGELPKDPVYKVEPNPEGEEILSVRVRVLSDKSHFKSELSALPEDHPLLLDAMADACDSLLEALYHSTSERGKLLLCALVIAQCNFYMEKEDFDPAEIGTAPNIAIPYVHQLAMESKVMEDPE
jgi:hypothetical protein